MTPDLQATVDEIRERRKSEATLKTPAGKWRRVHWVSDDIDTLLRALDAERAAVAELRELLCTHYLMWSAAGESTEWSFLKRMKSCPEDELNAALAEFRKIKEQAK